MPAVDASSLTKLAANFAAAAKDAKKEIGGALMASRRATHTEFVRAALQFYNVKASSLEKRFDVKDNPAQLSYKIVADDKGILISSFGGKANAKGILATIKKQGSPEFFEGGFFPSKGRRSSVGFKRAGAKRYPIAPVVGPSAAAIVADENVRRAVLEKINVVLSADVEIRIKRIVTRG